MNQTETYGLSQWEAEDRIMREDFNADNAKIEAALAEQSTAQAVLSAAITAAASKEHICVGSYTGSSESSRKITLPFTPKFLILFGYYAIDDVMYSFVTPIQEFDITSYGPASGNFVELVENGFLITGASWHNCIGKEEHYIAFG